ncbi:MAG: stage II sporulation protein M [Cytophagia bacterium]|nr:MAG: stage II sporulation protein M [Runella sp.]TAG16537.1 MAG: stage II sporulation protein M [Cytophagales bacterium]TAG35799.1 MAG: stage II sporulation protein M [Cytophagia bacterium]TAG55929.1 MAG: stage II sporulation protein M [Runella slithyformis]TAG77577.1 MAG: stage II sporulation protein M [Cytophagales bacterium]
MKEAVFVKRNTDKWREYEQTPTTDPDQLSERFIELTDDLSFARTFYPNAAVTKYLNGLTARFHQSLYANRREDRNRIAQFWKAELPLLMYEERFRLLYAFLFFGVACVLGWVSAMNDDTFVRLILGDSYVNQTLENIKKGDPLAIYKGDSQANMFLAITVNNIRVSFIAFVFGLLFSAGTMFVLFQNGVMLGAFQYFFYARGLLLASVLKIWIHGTLEISAIVIAGAAGLVVGHSLLFPKTYSRLESFKRGAKNGVKMVIGLVPIFIMAGFLESFVTRLTLPPLVSMLIIGVSAAFIVWYFIVYPRILFKKTYPKNETFY